MAPLFRFVLLTCVGVDRVSLSEYGLLPGITWQRLDKTGVDESVLV